MSEFVEIRYQAKVRVTVRADVNIPKEMIDRIPEGDEWSDEIEKYISERVDISDHTASVDYDDSDVEIWDVMKAKAQP